MKDKKPEPEEKQPEGAKMNATELRAALAPAVKMYKAIASMSDLLDDVVQEQVKLHGLQKQRADHDKHIVDLKAELDKLGKVLTKNTEDILNAEDHLQKVNNELKEKQAKLDRAESVHAAQLDKQKVEIEKTLAKSVEEADLELRKLRAEKAGVEAELRAAKHMLGEFTEKLNALKQ